MSPPFSGQSTQDQPEWRILTSWERSVKGRLHKTPTDSVESSTAATGERSEQHELSVIRAHLYGGPARPVRPKPSGAGHRRATSRQRKIESIAATSMVKVLPVLGMGAGVFAIRAVPAGVTFLREKPFITFKDPLTSIEVWNALQSISTDARDLFWGFRGTGAHQTTDVDIAETNLIPLEGDSACGMFATICRINHSCGPNARWLWDPCKRRMSVIAFRDIEIGEEITVSYLESADLLSSDRREDIQRFFRFDCQCKICSSRNQIQDPDKSHEIRQRVKVSFDRWETLPIDEWWSSDLSAEENRLRTLEVMDVLEIQLKNEGLWAFLPRLLEHRFMLHAAWGELEAAKSVGRQWEIEEKRVEKAIPNDEVKVVRRDPRKWGEWGKLRKLDAKFKKNRGGISA